MKICPKCGADVEGLIYRCDLCYALLDPRITLFRSVDYTLPACVGFSSLSESMLEALEPDDPDQYSGFLKKIEFDLYCWPESLIRSEKVRNRVWYSARQKFARVYAVVDINDYVYGNQDEKTSLVAEALLHGILSLHARLQKDKHGIDEIVATAEKTLVPKIIEE